ncbi:hypothetical protein [Rhizobium leguminosarum]|uniref:hypothetical protein n=1 Tax=Rhizobium leguminosarum TaxID=384 RepID=UPI0012DB44C4|nr:hypothetical protein [Rhizobium leguminosarum]
MFKSLANRFFDIFGSKEWAPHLLKGELVMRRRLPGRWEYRDLTPDETEEMVVWQAVK